MVYFSITFKGKPIADSQVKIEMAPDGSVRFAAVALGDPTNAPSDPRISLERAADIARGATGYALGSPFQASLETGPFKPGVSERKTEVIYFHDRAQGSWTLCYLVPDVMVKPGKIEDFLIDTQTGAVLAQVHSH